MKRINHLLLVVIPPIFIAIFARDEKQLIQFMMVHIVLVIPIATILRMKYYGFDRMQFFKSFIPLYGLRNRFVIFFREKLDVESEKVDDYR